MHCNRSTRDNPPRGEVVLLIGGGEGAPVPDERTLQDRAAALRASGATARDVARALAAEFGIGRNEAYRIAQAATDHA